VVTVLVVLVAVALVAAGVAAPVSVAVVTVARVESAEVLATGAVLGLVMARCSVRLWRGGAGSGCAAKDGRCDLEQVAAADERRDVGGHPPRL